MTEPEKDESATEARLHAGPRDEGGDGGMATRELHAHEAADGAADDEGGGS